MFQSGATEVAVATALGISRSTAHYLKYRSRDTSTKHYDRTAGCDIEPAMQAIGEVDALLSRISNIYTLSPADKDALVQVLAWHLRRLGERI